MGFSSTLGRVKHWPRGTSTPAAVREGGEGQAEAQRGAEDFLERGERESDSYMRSASARNAARVPTAWHTLHWARCLPLAVSQKADLHNLPSLSQRPLKHSPASAPLILSLFFLMTSAVLAQWLSTCSSTASITCSKEVRKQWCSNIMGPLVYGGEDLSSHLLHAVLCLQTVLSSLQGSAPCAAAHHPWSKEAH